MNTEVEKSMNNRQREHKPSQNMTKNIPWYLYGQGDLAGTHSGLDLDFTTELQTYMMFNNMMGYIITQTCLETTFLST